MTAETWITLGVFVLGLVSTSATLYARLAVLTKQVEALEKTVNRFWEFWDGRQCEVHTAQLKTHSECLDALKKRLDRMDQQVAD